MAEWEKQRERHRDEVAVVFTHAGVGADTVVQEDVGEAEALSPA